MQVEQLIWSKPNSWKQSASLNDANLVLYFGSQGTLNSGEIYNELRKFYPHAQIMGCSTGGEIFNQDVFDNKVVVSAVKFNETKLKTFGCNIKDYQNSYDIGCKLAQDLQGENLRNIFLLSDGTNVNGSELVRGIYSILDKDIVVTGGLAGDGADFGDTYVGINQVPHTGCVAAIGFYNKNLKIGYGSVGGWNSFGPERVITKSKDNILYELDGKPALDLYKEYLGEEAHKLPGSALLFPLNIKPNSTSKNELIRTIVGVDEENKSMIFAGDVPEGYIAQLMHSDFASLSEGAAKAAEISFANNDNGGLAILVSCIGRKLLMGQNISDETEAVADIFENNIPMIGFYSYGEICHQQFTNECTLHNQTMTITVINE
jgi:hypothetical protein